jgi:NAD-dependent dihydropyrimidine dehydrogenase PreA subunit
VITFPCIGVKDASCVDVCPVDCIHPALVHSHQR